jgi:hypothetical protein
MTFYNKVNKCYIEYINYEDIKTQSFKLLLDIIGNKTDCEFDIFYNKYISNFKLKQYYFTRSFNPYIEYNFNSFYDTKDFINKSCSICINDNFYQELNIFLTNVLKIIKSDEKKYNKKNIKIAVKKAVWDKYIGLDIGQTKCLCCKITDIIQMSFHCGHIIAEVNGGETIVSNLKPICQNCNLSMGTENMNEFMKKFK